MLDVRATNLADSSLSLSMRVSRALVFLTPVPRNFRHFVVEILIHLFYFAPLELIPFALF